MFQLKIKQLRYTILLFRSFLFISYTSEEDLFNQIIKRFENYNQSHPQEKVHLHLDKPYYAAGDDIWFKAYLVNNLKSGPSTLSGVLIVELLDQKDSLLQEIKLPVISGITWGNIGLKDTYDEGNYRIRAYTSWMKNFGDNFYYDKTIKIGNSWTNKVFTSAHHGYQTAGNQETITSNIKFTHKDQTPYQACNLRYEILAGSKSIKRGKAVTNSNGEVDLNFMRDLSTTSGDGKILISISLPNNQVVSKEIPFKSSSNNLKLHFFPESGNFIEGIPNKIGIKSVAASGLGQDIKGIIKDNEGNTITSFETQHLGMGSLIFIPESGKKYTAHITTDTGFASRVDLPEALKSGYKISVDQDNQNVQVNVSMTADLVNRGDLKLVVQHNSNILFISKAADSKQNITAKFPKTKLPAGIIQITLFSPENRPVCERLIFVHQHDSEIKTEITAGKKVYARKEKVQLNFKTTLNDQPVQGSFSVVVTNATAIKPDSLNESNIFTSLLLTSDLSGYVEKPNYYFLSKDKKTLEDLDNLLLTQGWRRFLWKEIIDNSIAKIRYQPEKTLQISGKVLTKGGKVIPKSRITLINSSGGGLSIDTLTDEAGGFNFDNLSFSDSTKFIVQAVTDKNKRNLEIKLDVAGNQVISRNKNTGDLEINVNETIASYLQQSESFFDQMLRNGMLQKSTLLKEINITAKKNPARNSSNLNGPGNADLVIVADQLQTCQTITQCLERGGLAGLLIKDGLPYISRFGNTNPMQLFLDGINIDSATFLNINPADIQAIEILKDLSKTAIYGRSASESGVIILTTKRAGDANFVPKNTPGMVVVEPKGYSLIKEFYSPNYEVEGAANIDDHRSTIYWNPNIVTSKNGTANITFFNANEPGLYRIVVEGMDLRGNLSHATYEYSVN